MESVEEPKKEKKPRRRGPDGQRIISTKGVKPRISEDDTSGLADKLGCFVMTPEGAPYPLPHDGGQFQEIVNKCLVKDPYMFHKEGSPYLGLTVQEQRILAKVRRGARKPPKWWIDSLREATKRDFNNLFLHCVNTLVRDWLDDDIRLDRSKVFVKLPFSYRQKFKNKMPEANVFAHEDYTVVVGWKVEKVIDWLYSLGHSPFEAKDLKKYIWVVLREQEKLDFYNEIAADESIVGLYGELIEGAKSGVISRHKEKGRVYSRYRSKKPKADNQESVLDLVQESSEEIVDEELEV